MPRKRKRSSVCRIMFDNLPDELLIAIVSSLPMKDAVRTSALAKRWKTIWKHTTNIQIHQCNFFKDDDVSLLDLARRQGLLRAIAPIADFADKLVKTYQGRKISSFSLVVGDAAVLLGDPLLDKYITFAVLRNVKHLTVDLTQPVWSLQPQPLRPKLIMEYMPMQFYNHCEDYESLNLSGVQIDLYHCCDFASLRSVSLSWLELRRFDLERLGVEAPCLEELRLVKCWGFDIEMQSKSLKTLVIDKCNLYRNDISVFTPNLKAFVYSGRFGDINFHLGVENLEEVYLDYDMEKDFGEFWTKMYIQFWQLLKNVRVLSVCSFVLQIIPFIIFDLHDVDPKHLTLKTSFRCCDFYGIHYFLIKCCKSVELLVIDITDRAPLNRYRYCPVVLDHDFFWEVDNPKPPAECLEKSLRILEVRGFSGTRHQVQFVKQIMCLGKVLEKIRLLYKKESDVLEEVAQAYQVLLGSRRSSSTLQITCN